MKDDSQKEIPKHRKKRNKKTVTKSKHKHIYDVPVLFLEEYNYYGFYKHYFRGWLCSICGKIGNTKYYELEGTKFMNSERIFEKYNHLPLLKFDWDKKYYKIDRSEGREI